MPGGGKTRVMVERARAILPSLPKNRGVLFLSFTEVAVSELEGRLHEEGLLQRPVFPHYVGTFDGFLWQFVVAPFGIPDVAHRVQLIPDQGKIEVAPHSSMRHLPLSCFDGVTGAIRPDEAARRGFDVIKQATSVARYEASARSCRASFRSRGQVDYEGVRHVVAERLQDADFSRRLGTAASARFAELIVDETQDCNPSDLAVINWLRASGIVTKVICDPHQSIYAFRGGVTDEITTFRQTFVAENQHSLSGNFRSSPNICKAIAMLRPINAREPVDEALGPYMNETSHIHVLPYAGQGVSTSIGSKFHELIKPFGFEPSSCPVVAATSDSALKAVGLASGNAPKTRTYRLAAATSEFYRAFEHGNVKEAVRRVHEIILEIEGKLAEQTYHQYIAGNAIEPGDWRPDILQLLRALRFDPATHGTPIAWQAAAKVILGPRAVDGKTIAQLLPTHSNLGQALNINISGGVPSKTIHSVKGKELPAVCVVTTSNSLSKILNYLETGSDIDQAEKARELYVAASRAERFLLFAVPKSQSNRFVTHLGGKGAEINLLSP